MTQSFFVATIPLLLCVVAQVHSADVPARRAHFAIQATENVSARFPGAPRLQSFASAQWNGKWIFMGGRTNGYHGVGPEADFPRARANTKIWVVDASRAPVRTFSFDIESLPASLGPVKDQLRATNLLHFQSGDILYLAGGYGQNSKGDWVTHSTLSAVKLPVLVERLQQGSNAVADAITFVISPYVQSSGGELLKLDDGFFYLVGGHVFTGKYSDYETNEEKNSAKASQRYLGEIRKLSITRRQEQLEVALVAKYENSEFARRDLNVAFTVSADGTKLGAAAYGGVFTKDQLNFSKPIYWSSIEAPSVEESFEQKMSSYSCARMVLFDPSTKSLHTTFFGGISRWKWDYKTDRPELAPRVGSKTSPVHLDGLEWIDQISTIVRTPEETYEVVHSTSRLPAHVGTNAVFLPVEGLERVKPGIDVFNMESLRGKRTLIGYLYGGVRAFPREFPYHDESPLYNSGNVPTKTSDLILAVYVTVPPA